MTSSKTLSLISGLLVVVGAVDEKYIILEEKNRFKFTCGLSWRWSCDGNFDYSS
jgi:hypothetical protein